MFEWRDTQSQDRKKQTVAVGHARLCGLFFLPCSEWAFGVWLCTTLSMIGLRTVKAVQYKLAVEYMLKMVSYSAR